MHSQQQGWIAHPCALCVCVVCTASAFSGGQACRLPPRFPRAAFHPHRLDQPSPAAAPLRHQRHARPSLLHLRPQAHLGQQHLDRSRAVAHRVDVAPRRAAHPGRDGHESLAPADGATLEQARARAQQLDAPPLMRGRAAAAAATFPVAVQLLIATACPSSSSVSARTPFATAARAFHLPRTASTFRIRTSLCTHRLRLPTSPRPPLTLPSRLPLRPLHRALRLRWRTAL